MDPNLDVASVLSLCKDAPMVESFKKLCLLGVDTGRDLHVVISRKRKDGRPGRQVVFLGVMKSYAELDDLIGRFNVSVCVIDGMPETHATGEFARRHNDKVLMCFFSDGQRGSARWDPSELKVTVNRVEALDASRAAVRNKQLILPRRLPMVEPFAKQMTMDAKKLEEDEQTGAQKYQYIKTGENHFSFAFTDALLAGSYHPPGWGVREYYRLKAQAIRASRKK